MPVVQAKTVVWPKPARPIQERAPDRARFGQRWACLKRAQESVRSFRRVPGAKGRPVSFLEYPGRDQADQDEREQAEQLERLTSDSRLVVGRSKKYFSNVGATAMSYPPLRTRASQSVGPQPTPHYAAARTQPR